MSSIKLITAAIILSFCVINVANAGFTPGTYTGLSLWVETISPSTATTSIVDTFLSQADTEPDYAAVNGYRGYPHGKAVVTVSKKGAFTVQFGYNNSNLKARGVVGDAGQIQATGNYTFLSDGKKVVETIPISLALVAEGGTTMYKGLINNRIPVVAGITSHSKQNPYAPPRRFTFWTEYLPGPDGPGITTQSGYYYQKLGPLVAVGNLRSDGNIVWAGRSPDGVPFTGSSSIWTKTGQVGEEIIFFGMKSGKRGIFCGWLKSDPSRQSTDWYGKSRWLRVDLTPPNKPTPLTSLDYNMPAFASNYVPPAKGTPPIDWSAGGTVALDIVYPVASAKTISVNGTIDNKGKFVAGGENSASVNFLINPKTGFITGGFFDAENNKKIFLYGIVNAKTAEGVGFFPAGKPLVYSVKDWWIQKRVSGSMTLY